jgi:hypothetical protein
MNEGAVTLWVGVISCLADFLCTILPIPVVLRLSMPLRQRIGVCVLLSAGIIVTVAGIVRTWFIYKSLIATYDETWFTYPLWICAALEIDIAVVSRKSQYFLHFIKLTYMPDMRLRAIHEGCSMDAIPQMDHLFVQQLYIITSRL